MQSNLIQSYFESKKGQRLHGQRISKLAAWCVSFINIIIVQNDWTSSKKNCMLEIFRLKLSIAENIFKVDMHRRLDPFHACNIGNNLYT